jgi:hypothetical protein
MRKEYHSIIIGRCKLKREIKTPEKEGSIPRQVIKKVVKQNPPKRFKMTRDEIIEELMDEWWNSLEGNVAEDMISVYLDEVGAELVEEKNE